MRLRLTATAIALLSLLPTQAREWRVQFGMCGRDRVTCVVDGDTIWLQGVNLRLESYDTPEPYNDICGGQAEVALAKRASCSCSTATRSTSRRVARIATDVCWQRSGSAALTSATSKSAKGWRAAGLMATSSGADLSHAPSISSDYR